MLTKGQSISSQSNQRTSWKKF